MEEAPLKSDPSCWFASPEYEVKRQEVSILLTFTLSEHVHSPWVVSKSLHDLAPLDIFSFNSLLLPNPMVQSYWTTQNSLLWHVFMDLFVIAHAILFATNPLFFAIISWDMFKLFFQTERVVFSCESTRSPWSHESGASVSSHSHIIACNQASVYLSPFLPELWDPWSHVCHFLHILRAGHSFWFIIGFNRKQKNSNRNLIVIYIPFGPSGSSKKKIFS